MKNSQARISRRTFLLAATGGTAATAAAIVGRKASDPGRSQEKSTADASGGYQLTEHVRNYYRTARI